ADRDQAAVAGERVPHRGEDREDEQLGELLGGIGGERERDEREGDDERTGGGHREPGRAGPAPDDVALGHVRLRASSMRPRGLARTPRKTRWPASIEYCGWLCA